jgi:hypothetical protein
VRRYEPSASGTELNTCQAPFAGLIDPDLADAHDVAILPPVVHTSVALRVTDDCRAAVQPDLVVARFERDGVETITPVDPLILVENEAARPDGLKVLTDHPAGLAELIIRGLDDGRFWY